MEKETLIESLTAQSGDRANTATENLRASILMETEILKVRNLARLNKDFMTLKIIQQRENIANRIDSKIIATFASFKQAMASIKFQNDQDVNRRIYKEDPGQIKELPTEEPCYRIVVSNLCSTVTENDIFDLFEDIGEVYEARLLGSGRAVVNFKTLNDAENAIEAFHNRSLDGQAISCELEELQCGNSDQSEGASYEEILIDKFGDLSIEDADPILNSVSNSRIVKISNLHSLVTKSDIEDLFGEIGEITEVRIIQRGLAEVVYEAEEDARKAVHAFFEKPLDGRPIICWIDCDN